MSLKRSFIQMSITKQIYCGLFGMAVLTCTNVFILIFCTSLILTNIIRHSVNNELERMDNDMINIYAQFADVTAILFLDLGKYDIALLRLFYKNLIKEESKTSNNYFEQLTSSEDNFIDSTDNSNQTCDTNGNCFAYLSSQSSTLSTFNSNTKKKLELMIPLLKVSMNTKPYNKEPDSLFQEIYFYFKEDNTFLSFPYNSKKITTYLENIKAFENNATKFEELNRAIVTKFKTESFEAIKANNYINYSTCSYDDLVLYNPATVTSFSSSNIIITPYFDVKNQCAETGSFSFQLSTPFNCQDTSNITDDNLIDYIGGKWDYNVLNKFSISLTNQSENLYAMLVSNTPSMLSLSWQVCKILRRLGNLYSNGYDGGTTVNESETKLSLDMNISSCFVYDKARKIIEEEFSSNATQYTIKRLQFPFASYSSSRDINKEIKVKVFQFFTPSNYIRSLVNSPFYTTYTFYYFLIKIQNTFRINQHQIYFLFINLIFFILLISLIVWIIIFALLWTRVCVVANSISSPINKLIANISNSQNITNSQDETSPLDASSSNALVVNEPNNEVDSISYPDDKDIDELFKICQVLIVGGFKQKECYKRNNAMNVYNNVAVVKTNNLMINEYEIESKKDEDYHEIFKDEEVKSNKALFEKEVYKKFETDKLKNSMKEFYNKKYEKLDQKAKNEFSKKEKNDDYKFLRMVNKDIEEYLPVNSLYKLYTEEMVKKEKSKSGNKKEKKNLHSKIQ